MRTSIIIVGAAAAVLGGCGSIGNTTGASSGTATTASPSPARGNGTAVVGQVAEVGSGKLTVTDRAGNVTVTYDSSTSVLQSGTGSLTDVVQGACVGAMGQKDAAGAITATTLTVMLNMNGNCTPPAGVSGGVQGNRGASPSPAGASPGLSFGNIGNGAQADFTNVRGKVTAVSGGTLTVQPQTGDSVTVVVPSTARVTRLVTSTAARLAAGECVTANGQRDSSGTVKARSILISAPGPNGCTRGGFGGGGRPSASPSTQPA
ncbi:MAG TPA: DUF5666 domain-containing protein [Candidatus Dormibacteraeota bacterium]